MQKTFVLSCLAAVAVEARDLPLGAANTNQFLQWAASNGKSYTNASEMARREAIWIQDRAEVASLNAKSKSATFAQNFMSDLTKEEQDQWLGFIEVDEAVSGRHLEAESLDALDAEARRSLQTTTIDWSAVNTTAVKNQGGCGSCVAFATTTAAEAMWSIKNGNSTPVRLSEQHVMDCSHRDNVDYFDINYKNIGCSGGYLDEYFKFMVEQGVIDYSVYPLPYSATDQPCVHDAADVKFKGINNGRHTSKTVSGIVSLLERGPLVIAITAGGTTFNRYKTGVLNTEDGCPESVGLNHAVTVVGYGSYQVEEQLNPPIQSCNKDKTKRDCTGAGEFWSQGQCCTEISSMTVDKNYYLVQNSWSSNYGDGGFVRFNAQDGNGICGMNRWVTYLNV